MKNIPVFLLSVGLVLSCSVLISCGGESEPASSQTDAQPAAEAVTEPQGPLHTESQKMHAFMDEVFERNVAAYPEAETYLGRKTDQQGQWDDYSDAFEAAQLELDQQDLAFVRENFAYDQLDDNGKLSYDLFAYNIGQAVEDFAWRRHDYVVDQFRGQVSSLFALLQNPHKIDTEKDAEDYVQRIAGLKEVFEVLAWQLRDRSDFGVATPAFAYTDIIEDIGNMTSGAPITDDGRENPLMADFQNKLEKLELSEEARAQLEAAAIAALTGPFSEGAAELMAELLYQQAQMEDSLGVWSLPEGEAYYQNRIRHFTTLDLTAEEVHQAGLRDVARIHDEMRAIMAEVGFEGSLQAFFEFVRNDPNNYYENSDAGREEFLAEARQQIAEIMAISDQYFNILPEAELEVRRVEPWRENSTSIAFYNRPSEDGSRPGIYYANMKDMTNFQKYVFTAITFHESAPGHHFQIANAMELEEIPQFRKQAGYGAYTEGWALYAEQLAREMGFYQDPMRNFGRLQDEIWRSVRLVVDTGIHSLQWTRQQAINYFLENTPLSEGDIVTEVERFFVNPGQALGYKIGMMKILELRERAREALGEDFDIRAFHDVVIGRGPMPLPVLEQQVNAWIASETSS
ncbi:MAG TPA: DUF885 domain-containing protein [Xanthomonadales bacterium]|nr:DUF885 domain-containing protein [Xanthomonadales bacterium]